MKPKPKPNPKPPTEPRPQPQVWQFWRVERLGERLHAREHFAVNVAVAGGLLLIQEVSYLTLTLALALALALALTSYYRR